MDSYSCLHPELTFMSGGFYIGCRKCNATWIAIKNFDADIDYERGSGPLSGHTWLYSDPAVNTSPKTTS
jgi:hypothetical protein